MPHGHHQPVSLGLLGSGFVAEFYMDGLRDVPGAHVVANYSRSAERAEEFGKRNGVPGELLVRLCPIKVLSDFDVSG